MKHILVFALALVALTVAPVNIVEPADACQPYEVYCPLNGERYRGCGNSKPLESPMARCARDMLPP